MANTARIFLLCCCAMLLAPLVLFAGALAWPVTMYHNLHAGLLWAERIVGALDGGRAALRMDDAAGD